jgi:hypothetical protein
MHLEMHPCFSWEIMQLLAFMTGYPAYPSVLVCRVDLSALQDDGCLGRNFRRIAICIPQKLKKEALAHDELP